MKKRIFGSLLVLLLFCMSACGGPVAQQSQEKETRAETTVPTAGQTEETAPPQTTETVPPAIIKRIPADVEFVKISDWIPDVYQELYYATDRNFTGQVIYDFEDAYLRYGTVKKLGAVCADLREMGLYVKIWDGFRPVSAQFTLWEICPDPTYVADPNVGYSSHSRGNTVDLTLVDENGVELEMPTAFDDFSPKADRDYSDCSEAAANNAEILQILMEKHGFTGYFGEWWHFSDTMSYPVEREFEPQ